MPKSEIFYEVLYSATFGDKHDDTASGFEYDSLQRRFRKFDTASAFAVKQAIRSGDFTEILKLRGDINSLEPLKVEFLDEWVVKVEHLGG